MTPERYRRIRATLDRRQPDLTLVMAGVHKPHNIAAIIRTCDAVGVFRAHAVLPDNRSRVPAGTAMGSQRWVDIRQHDTAEQAIRQVREGGCQVLAAHFSEHAVPYREIDFTRPTALLLGTEKYGVDEICAEQADEHVMIPMMGMVESFNVSVAAAIILSEACEQRRRAGMYDRPRLDDETYRRTLFRWGYPRLAALCDERGLNYPSVDEQGGVDAATLGMLEEGAGGSGPEQ